MVHNIFISFYSNSTHVLIMTSYLDVRDSILINTTNKYLLNSNRPSITNVEKKQQIKTWYVDNKEYIIKQHKTWRLNNKTLVKKY